MAMRKGSRRHSGPSLSKWNTYHGDGKHYNYDFYTAPISEGGKQYSISQFNTDRGRHAGYLLSVFPGRNNGHAGIDSQGHEVMINSRPSVFRSPQSAARAAGLHMARHRS